MYGHESTTSDRNLVESKKTGKMRWSLTMLVVLAVCFWLGSGVLRNCKEITGYIQSCALGRNL